MPLKYEKVIIYIAQQNEVKKSVKKNVKCNDVKKFVFTLR